jgi:hypothetical protein
LVIFLVSPTKVTINSSVTYSCIVELREDVMLSLIFFSKLGFSRKFSQRGAASFKRRIDVPKQTVPAVHEGV